MKIRRSQIVICLAPLVVLSWTSRALADDPPRADLRSEQALLATEIRQRVDEIQSIRRQRFDADKRHLDELTRLRRQIETLDSQLGPAEETVKDQREQIAQLERDVARDCQSAVANRAWIERVAAAATPVATRAAKRSLGSAADDPASRAVAFESVTKLLADEVPSQRASGAKELCRLLSDEWLPARTVGLSNQQVILDGGRLSHHAWVYRLGLVSKAFVAEGGAPMGLSSGDEKSPWTLDVSEESQRHIRELLDVAHEQKAPAILPVPVRIGPAATVKP